MKIFRTILVLALLGLSTSSFSQTLLPGTYGSCLESNTIKLVLNDDGTFTYQDYSNPKNQIDITGKWENSRGRRVVLLGHDGLKFHKNWKIEKDGIAAKSRHGLTFYRLINGEKCNKKE